MAVMYVHFWRIRAKHVVFKLPFSLLSKDDIVDIWYYLGICKKVREGIDP